MCRKNVDKKSQNRTQSKNIFSDDFATKTFIIYWFFAALRIITTLIPQSGYIHPDEYFQSIEVIAGDHFDIDVFKPWEYNVTFPIRSTIISKFFIGIPYTIVNIVSPYLWYYFQINLKTAYILVLLPRIFICLLSFISDYCLYKICRNHRQEYYSRLTIYASSYIMIVHSTHTLSNSVELILVALLIYYVSRCMIYSEEIVSKSDHILESYKNAPNIVERVKYYKLQASIPGHSLNDCLIIATITVIGIFNRPTFIAFGFVPVFFWLQRGLGSLSVNFWDFHLRIITFIACTVPLILLIIIYDSFYFGYLTLGEIVNLKISINSFVVTPLNFFKYNLLTENLQTHGLHPRFLHFLINVPLLYNILGIIGLLTFIHLVYRIFKSRWLELPRTQSIESLMTACFIVPIAILSVFPHQEPRFIIPTLLPLVYLHAPTIKYGIKTDIAVAACSNGYRRIYTINKGASSSQRMLKVIWFGCNVIFAIFYGFLHQGGVFPLTSHIAKELRAKPELTHIHLFTSYTYPVPTALLQMKNTQRVYTSTDKHRYQLKQDVFLHEYGSKAIDNVFDDVLNMLSQCEKQFSKRSISCRIYYAMPKNFYNEFFEYSMKNGTKNIKLQIVNVFYPHISTEKLPLINIFTFLQYKFSKENFIYQVEEFFENFGLLLVKIEAYNSKNITI